MRFRIKLVGVLACVILAGASTVLAQQKGQWVPGQFGLNAGVIPDPCITYANLALNYSVGQLNDSFRVSLVTVLGGREYYLLRPEPQIPRWVFHALYRTELGERRTGG